jgi:hypothetical protein
LANLKFNPVKKDRLFYDQFEYCIGFYLEEASCLRILNHAHVDEFIERRKQWREIAQQRWVNGVQKHGIIMSRRWKEITEKTVADLHALTEQLLLTKSEFKLVVSVDQGYIYSNDVSFLEQLSCMPELNHKTFTQATVTRPKNTIQLKNPQHQFRTYLKLSKLTVQQKDQLENFLSNQQSQVRLSPGLKQWVNQPFNRLQDYFFIDHDSQTWLTMLGLVVPGIVRKTMHIIVAK